MSRATIETIKRKLRELGKVFSRRAPFVISYDPRKAPRERLQSEFSSPLEYLRERLAFVRERYNEWRSGLTQEEREDLTRMGETHVCIVAPEKASSSAAWVEETLQDQLAALEGILAIEESEDKTLN